MYDKLKKRKFKYVVFTPDVFNDDLLRRFGSALVCRKYIRTKRQFLKAYKILYQYYKDEVFKDFESVQFFSRKEKKEARLAFELL